MYQDHTVKELREELYYLIKELAIQTSGRECQQTVRETIQQVQGVRPHYDWETA